MSKSHQFSRPSVGEFSTPAKLTSGVKRRRTLPVATAAAAAAIGLAGCTSMPFGHDPQEAAAPLNAQQQQAAERVKDFTSNIDIALDQVDRERLRAAAEKKRQAAVASTATQPAVVPAAQSGLIVKVTQSVPAESPVIAAPVTEMPVTQARPGQPTVTQSPVTTTVQTLGVHPQPATPAPSVEEVATPEQNLVGSSITASESAPSVVPAPVEPAAARPAITASADETSPSVITPVATLPPSTPSAMGAMTAMVMPATVAPVVTPAPAVSSEKTPSGAVQAPEEPTLDDAMALVRKRVAAHPTLNTALALALLDTGDAKAGDVAKSLSESDRKVYDDLLAALQSMNAPAAGATVADRAAPLVNAAKKWQAEADLSLPKVVLATRVDSFGVYTAVEPKFEQGKRHTVIIYCEVANFSSKKTDDGWYQTSLSQQETLITDDGLLVWRPNSEEVDDRSLNQRHDFYLVKKLTIPENLAAGKYTLRMSVTDRNTNKISMVSLPVEIVTK